MLYVGKNVQLTLNSSFGNESGISKHNTENSSSEVESSSNLHVPEGFALSQNYPNPFNPVTHIRFDLPEAGDVKIEIFNVLGEKITTLINNHFPAGYHNIVFKAGNYASGVYLYRIQTPKHAASKKMILMK